MDVRLDSERNLLIFPLAPGLPSAAPVLAPAAIDIGEGGRLLAIEVALPPDLAPSTTTGGSQTITFDATTSTLLLDLERQERGLFRTATITVGLVIDDQGMLLAIELPRRGNGYELTYPSGNQ